MRPVCEVRNLRKVFGRNMAVEDVSFEIARGEILGVLGPNGAGKTTIIHILLGLTTPTSGRVQILGRNLEEDREEILRRCNFASAFINLPANLKVSENLRVVALLYGIENADDGVGALLERFGIAHLRNRISGHLSSGETTRLNLCKALLNNPEFLLLDEPTASLDPDMADQFRKVLRELQRERDLSILYTSHNMRDVEEVCDRVLFINEGRIIAQGTPQEVVRAFKQKNLEDVFIRVARGGELY